MTLIKGIDMREESSANNVNK